MNYILFALLTVLGCTIFVLMNRRDELKGYEAESDEAITEVELDKFVALIAGVVAATVAMIAVLEIEVVWWFAVLEAAAIVVAWMVLANRLRHQREVLATCIDVRERRRKAARY